MVNYHQHTDSLPKDGIVCVRLGKEDKPQRSTSGKRMAVTESSGGSSDRFRDSTGNDFTGSWESYPKR